MGGGEGEGRVAEGVDVAEAVPACCLYPGAVAVGKCHAVPECRGGGDEVAVWRRERAWHRRGEGEGIGVGDVIGGEPGEAEVEADRDGGDWWVGFEDD